MNHHTRAKKKNNKSSHAKHIENSILLEDIVYRTDIVLDSDVWVYIKLV